MMPFMNLQKPSWKGEYLQIEQSHDESGQLLEKSEMSSSEQRTPRRRLVLFFAIFAFLYSVLTTSVLILQMVGVQNARPNLIYTPARHIMGYRLSGPISAYPNAYHEDPYFGDPSLELDQRWVNRLRYATIRLSPEEFSHYNQSGILLGDGTGYLATPTVYHDLHCMRLLHKTVYPEYYFPNDTEKKQIGRNAHARHCLHNLYHSLTCNADMTIRVMKWHPNLLLPSPVDHEHECMNWDSIEGWAKKRYVNTATPGLLVHPTKGEVFPGGKYVEHD